MAGLDLTPEEIAQACDIDAARQAYPLVMNITQVAAMLGVSVKTVRGWRSRGYLNNTFRRRGKRLFFWRDRVLRWFFNGPRWKFKGNKHEKTPQGRGAALPRELADHDLPARQGQDLPDGLPLEGAAQGREPRHPEPQGG
jgi:hypothetical protein